MSLRSISSVVASLGAALLFVACAGTGPTSTAIPQASGKPEQSQATAQALETLLATAVVTASPKPSQVPVPTPSPTANLIPPPQQTAAAFNPCALLSDEQASAINKVTYGPGVASTVSPALVECVWQSSSPHASITVQVGALSNVSEAQQAYEEAVASQDFAVTDVPNFGDKAAIVRAPHSANTGGIYVREGKLLYDVVYLGGAAPTDGELKLAAEIVLGALPDL